MHRVREQLRVPSPAIADGSGIVVGVLDTGIGQHPDLSGKLMGFQDFVGRRSQMYDDNGHGTHVCGILCGDGSASWGKYMGMAPAVRLVVGKVLDEKGDGSTESMLKGLDWILKIRKQYRIRILNISVGIGSLDEIAKMQQLKAKIEEVWDSGILVVCAAGNKGPDSGTVSEVGNSSKAIMVGCHDGNYGIGQIGRCETYSGRGEEGAALRKPDLVAPGTDIMSCNVHYYRLHGNYRNAYVAKCGTSMATPIVSGAAALTMQKYPQITNEECKQKLQYTATDLHLPWNQQGWGMVNVERMLRE